MGTVQEPRVIRAAHAAMAGVLLLGWQLSGGCTATRRPVAPEPVVHRLKAEPAASQSGMVASSSPAANRIGVEVLAAGGNAVDAAVAMAFALGVADAGDAGLGGTSLILVRMADGRMGAIDGSSPVPMRVSVRGLARILEEGRKFGPELSSTPGALAGLEMARAEYGTMSLAELLAPSIVLADTGTPVSPFQSASIGRYLDDVRIMDPLASIVLGTDGNPLLEGSLLRWPGLAETLRAIATGGAREFYRGAIAARIEADMSDRGGPVRRIDLARVRARRLEPMVGSYRGL
jgi:gamma-glutamyltranspeptidase/glutathione hydrolase